MKRKKICSTIRFAIRQSSRSQIWMKMCVQKKKSTVLFYLTTINIVTLEFVCFSSNIVYIVFVIVNAFHLWLLLFARLLSWIPQIVYISLAIERKRIARFEHEMFGLFSLLELLKCNCKDIKFRNLIVFHVKIIQAVICLPFELRRATVFSFANIFFFAWYAHLVGGFNLIYILDVCNQPI